MKILKQIEQTATASPVTAANITPENAIQVLVEGRDLAIQIFEFIKFFTSDTADAKIDNFIAALNALPVTPKP